MEGGYRRGEGGCPKESSYWFRLWKEGGKNLIKKGENQRFLIICKIKLCITCDDLYWKITIEKDRDPYNLPWSGSVKLSRILIWMSSGKCLAGCHGRQFTLCYDWFLWAVGSAWQDVMDCSSHCAMPALGREATPQDNSLRYCNTVIDCIILYNTV